HSRSTVTLDGELAGGGIGCHGMSQMMTQEERQTVNAAPMGAEGSAFIGVAPFVETPHFVQNVGDGTFFHSASQSLRACVAAGVDVTLKLLYNWHVALTGGQDPTGARDVDTLPRYLEADGVSRTIVVAEDPGAHRSGRLAVVPDRPQREGPGPARGALARRVGGAGARPARGGPGRRVPGVHARDRRHGRGHRQPGAGLRRDAGGPVRPVARPDRPGPE